MAKIIECVPNFSEGRNAVIINSIAKAIKNTNGVKLLDIDPGLAANRTVMSFAGAPENVFEAAFQAIIKASELIDMEEHHGEHPRFGATDVCPLIPVANVTMEETIVFARKLAERVGRELEIPVYCYEYAAFREDRKNLANCRKGSYEGLKTRMTTKEGKPDFGPQQWTERIKRIGAVAIGARDFLVAFNVNLDTKSVNVAKAIAFDIRESGRLKREGDPVVGRIVTNEKGEPVRIPGTLKKTRAIGWYIEEYGIAQVSMNLTDINVTPIHKAFEEVKVNAKQHNVSVTGSEIVGLVPLKAMLDAGRYYLEKQKFSSDVTDELIIKAAIFGLGLDNIKPFNPKKKIIEYLMS